MHYFKESVFNVLRYGIEILRVWITPNLGIVRQINVPLFAGNG